MKKLFLICGILWIFVTNAACKKRVVCYWNSFSITNEGLKGLFEVKDIDPKICTHIIYTYLRFTGNVNYFSDFEKDVVYDFINLKKENPSLKLLIGVGGPRQGTQIPSRIASTATDREIFSQKVKGFIDDYNFDGCDFDWQYPGIGTGSSESDRENYVMLLENLRRVLTNDKILSISVAPKEENIEKSYDILKIIQYVDFINLNVFNLHGSQEETATAFHSAYTKNPNDVKEQSEWNAVSIVRNWLSKGCPSEKLTLGIPTYGRSFTLADINKTGVGAIATGIGKNSEYLTDSNLTYSNIPYVEICYNLISNAKWSQFWDATQFAPYAVYNANQWVGFDDLTVLKAKIHLAIDYELGGLNFATIDRDDFYGQCGGGKFPLIKMGYEAIVNDNIPDNPIEVTTTTPKPSATSPTTKITTTPSSTVSSTQSSKDPDEDTRPTTITTTTNTVKTSTTTKTTTKKPTTIKNTTIKVQTPSITPVGGDSTIKVTTTQKSDGGTQGATTKVITDTTKIPRTPPITPGSRNIVKRSADLHDSENFSCPDSHGKFKNSENDNSFIFCAENVPFEFYCDEDSYFDEIKGSCEQY